MKPDVKFSIIMAIKGACPYVQRALNSLLEQNWDNWECLIQDGGMDDEGQNLLSSLAKSKTRRIQMERTQDSGVYDAWNKALRRATGQWLLFLGSDDALADAHCLARSARILTELPPEICFVQGGLNLGKNGKVSQCLHRSKSEIFRFFPSSMPLLTPAVFFRKSLFEAGQGFDPSYAIAGDFAFVAKHLKSCNVATLPHVLSYMELGGLSSSLRHKAKLDAERQRILCEQVLPRASEIVQGIIDTYGDTKP